jgi:uncharacterized protein
MPSPADTLIDVRSLIDRPGATRSLDRHVAVPAHLADDLVEVGPNVTVAAIIERVVDGLLVRGTVSAPVRVACARCLAERDDELRADVAELFDTRVGAEDDAEPGYAIVDATIDLDTLIRDALAAVMPTRPLCRPDCAGLCPVCGADRNVVGPDDQASCADHPEPHDQRWAALSDLRLPDAG